MFSRALILSALCAIALAVPSKRALPSGDVTCGSNVYTVSQVSAAVSAGFSHRNSPLGSDSYPHQFFDDEGLELFCSGSSWLEYPILTNAAYNGGSPGADRVIFNTAGTYCAVVTHTGASSEDGFVSCRGD
ncbi:guanyl-specific ribonuclease C2 [Mycena rosella]|uniref:Guanyl-specific ribonuclease C2 n=1 Tax=Mycena rosella TaxID=1033263 RepID=A0AAD7GJH7_MYCRO|nr:guanyl-specific ribonuclease C2 [Mycena rosella]